MLTYLSVGNDHPAQQLVQVASIQRAQTTVRLFIYFHEDERK